MHNRSRGGFTLIELLVVIAIIGMLSTLAVVALNSARRKSRDSVRVADVKQVQTALALYQFDVGLYPVAVAPGVDLGGTGAISLCSNGGWKDACDPSDVTYMIRVPGSPTPIDGSCSADENSYTYVSDTGLGYSLDFCLGGVVGELGAGTHTSDQTGIR